MRYNVHIIKHPWGTLNWPYAVTRLTAHFMCGLRSDLVICKFRKSIAMTPDVLTWPGVIKQHQPTITFSTIGGDKVSMLTHTYPHKPLRKIKVTIYAIIRLTTSFMCGLMSDLVICKFRKVWLYMTPNILNETRCPWTTQTQPNPFNYVCPKLKLKLDYPVTWQIP